MKNISTLVEDIYQTLKPKKSKDEFIDLKKNLKEFSKNVSDLIESYVNELEEESVPYLRPSNLGTPDRKLWYIMNTEQKDYGFNGPKKLSFLYGHIIEQLVILLAKAAGHKVSNTQQEVTLHEISGSIDSVIDGVLVDVKSASPYSFAKFKNGTLLQDDPFGYREQISFYARAKDVDQAGFLALDKSSGELALLMVDPTFDLMQKEEVISAIDNKRKVVHNKDSLPDRCYSDEEEGKSGNRGLSKGCSWCPFKFDCWSDANDGKGLRVFQYSNGLKYLTKVESVPKVPELVINGKEEENNTPEV